MLSIRAQVGSRSDAALLNTIINGIYTGGSSLVICLVYAETPTLMEAVGAVAVVLGVVCIDRMRRPAGTLKAQHETLLPASSRVEDESRLPVLISILAGVFWAFSSLGQRIGVTSTPVELLKEAQAIVTTFVWDFGCILPPALGAAHQLMMKQGDTSSHSQPKTKLASRRWTVMAVCGGMFSGLGSLSVTYAFALSAGKASASILMVANGTFMIFTFFAIALCFRESPSSGQSMGALVVLVGILATST